MTNELVQVAVESGESALDDHQLSAVAGGIAPLLVWLGRALVVAAVEEGLEYVSKRM
jgi:hypothetical protein